jgi:hypothetical protein
VDPERGWVNPLLSSSADEIGTDQRAASRTTDVGTSAG